MRLLTGRPHRLLSEVIARIGERAKAQEPCMLLVPSQYTLQAEIEVITQLNLNGSFLIDVLSPTRLQSRVFEREGAPDAVILDERGKQMVLTEAVEAERDQLTIYRAAASNPKGLVEKLSSLIADLKRSGADSSALLSGMDALEENDPVRKKLQDAARIMTAYEGRMAGQLADGEDVARIMREKLPSSGVLDGKHVYIYGFDMITETFAKDILAMSRCSASLTLAVETDANSAPDGYLFAPVNFSLERLKMLAKDGGIPIETEEIRRYLPASWDICLLEKRLFALGRTEETGTPEHIALFAASSPRAEVHRVGSAIRKLAAEGASLSGVAVVYPKGTGYAPLLESILPMYGVKAYVAQKRPAGAHPLCRFLLSSLRAASGGYATEDVLECLRSGFIRVTRDEADALAAYAEGADIRRDGWKKPFVYGKLMTEDALLALDQTRETLIAPLETLRRALTKAKTADQTVAAIIRLLEDVNAYDTLEAMRAELTESGMDAQAQDCAQVWNALMETLDQLHTLLGEKAASAKTVLSLLESGLSALELAALPPADGAVICGEIGNVRTAEPDTLFALGMNDVGGGGEDGLFTGAERDAAARATGAYLGMSASERAALAQLDILKTLSGCRGKLVLSYSLADETGRALREGTAVQALRRLFPTLPIHGGLPQDELLDMLTAPDSALEALAVHLSRAADGKEDLFGTYETVYAALREDGAQTEKLAAITRLLSEEPARALDAAQARSLYGRPVMSVSRLEMMAKCPYQHFVQYGLTPQRELEPGVDRAELGTLYHEAAEQFTRAVTALPGFPEVSAETCDALMDKATAPLIDVWRKSPLGESARGGAIAARIKKTARRAARIIIAQYQESRFSPMSFELSFGQGGVAPVILSLGDGTNVYLQGRIDRIDVLDAETRHIRIIDYKSGAKKFDPTMAYWGIQLQLLIYLAAALSRIDGAQPAGFFYCRIADPTVKTESRIKEEVEKQIAKKLELAGISLSDVTILRAQDAHHSQMVTKDGTPSGRYAASMVDETGMNALLAFAKDKARQLARDAYGGQIDDSPAVHGQFSACALCDYAAICGFDPARKERRRLNAKKLDDLIGRT